MIENRNVRVQCNHCGADRGAAELVATLAQISQVKCNKCGKVIDTK